MLDKDIWYISKERGQLGRWANNCKVMDSFIASIPTFSTEIWLWAPNLILKLVTDVNIRLYAL